MEINKELYEHLLNIDYFCKCVESTKELYDFDIYAKKDLDNAIKSLSKTSWSNIVLEDRNKIGPLPCGWSGKYPHGKIKVY